MNRILGIISIAAIVIGMGAFVVLLSHGAAKGRESAKALATCQQENAELRGKVQAFTQEQTTALRNLDYLKGCPDSMKDCMLMVYRAACKDVPSCEAKVILAKEASK